MIIQGDAIERLRTLSAGSVQCCVTSPPYWLQRDYGVEGQIGLEPTVSEYLEAMVEVFQEVRRVLRPDGVLWLNMGDGYATRANGPKTASSPSRHTHGSKYKESAGRRSTGTGDLKHKDLVGMPWRLALALQDAGWYLRSEVIWHKPNVMPESVTDRPTRAHEHLFMLTKAARYYYDAEAIKEPVTGNVDCTYTAPGQATHTGLRKRGIRSKQNASFSGAVAGLVDKRNARTVWSINTHPLPEGHFASFPPALAERCIKAGTSQKGACPECGSPWVRDVKRQAMVVKRSARAEQVGARHVSSGKMVSPPRSETTGWSQGCACAEGAPVPCAVLDPFMGAGTVAMVARSLGRKWVGIELNPEYVEMIKRRVSGSLFANVPEPPPTTAGTKPTGISKETVH